MSNTTIDLEGLLKLRLAIARCGEMDGARWWNTQGQLGRRGAAVLRRGFPRTHLFAQARSVFAAAAARCVEVHSLPGAMTLWWLGEDIEEAFDIRWEDWLDQVDRWTPFFDQIAELGRPEPAAVLVDLGLVEPSDVEIAEKLQVDASGVSVKVPTSARVAALLALGFAKGGDGRLVVPYALSGS
ncbi:BrxE family protein [Brevundimonas bacteroides]|uniref:BrxE family protein n=1 Tax=Brevundimonas bacteroides TaxID=74311 RepID=UPI0004981B4D|nr:BrxE family protein [Brevundimonas bacteroides]